MELAILSVKNKVAVCRELKSGEKVIFRLPKKRGLVPGEILTIKGGQRIERRGKVEVTGTPTHSEIALERLGIVPLRLNPMGNWDPLKDFFLEEGGAVPEWAKSIVKAGVRPQYEMEYVMPGADFSKPGGDPIVRALDLADAGDRDGAERILMDLLEADLRCLDAHGHLANLAFDRRPEDAIRHYAVAETIGEMSLDQEFDEVIGVLPWIFLDNRPFLRCMHGLGLCFWREGNIVETLKMFIMLLWLNPNDDQGIRFLIGPVQRGERFQDQGF